MRTPESKNKVRSALQGSHGPWDRKFLDALNDAVIIFSQDMTIVAINQRGQELLGYPKAELIGNSIDCLMSGETPSGLAQKHHDIFKQELPSELGKRYEFWVAKKSGERFFAEMYANFLGGGKDPFYLASFRDTTEQKQATIELQKLASIVQHTSELINLAAFDGQMLFLNTAGQKMLGIAPEDVERMNIMQVIPEHLRETVEHELMPALLAGGTWEGELQYFNLKTGAITDVHAIAFGIEDPDTKEMLHLANVSIDITERKKAEKSLQESETMLRRVTDNMLDMVGQSDLEGRWSYVSPSCKRFLGFTSEEMVGQPIFDFVHPDDQAGLLEAYLKAQKELHSAKYEFRHRHADGHYVWLESIGNPILDENGAFAGGIYSSREITERKEAEELLQQREEYFRTLIENSSDLITIIDESFSLCYVSPSVKQILGYTPEESMGQSATDRLHPDEITSILDKLSKLTAKLGQEERLVYRIQHKNGSWVTFSGVARNLLDQPTIGGIVINSRDVSEAVRSEERLKRINRCFLAFGTDPLANITDLTTLCGELLEADYAVYSRSTGEQLFVVGQWNTPAGYPEKDLAEGHISFDVISQELDEAVVIPFLQETAYAETDPNVRNYGLRTYLGRAVKSHGKVLERYVPFTGKMWYPRKKTGRY